VEVLDVDGGQGNGTKKLKTCWKWKILKRSVRQQDNPSLEMVDLNQAVMRADQKWIELAHANHSGPLQIFLRVAIVESTGHLVIRKRVVYPAGNKDMPSNLHMNVQNEELLSSDFGTFLDDRVAWISYANKKRTLREIIFLYAAQVLSR
jgi:hypothetical protein